MEQCLDLNTLEMGLRNLELMLYAPWLAFAATWLLSFVFYNAVLFFSSIFLNYFIYAHTMYLARGISWLSPLSRACQSPFYDIYRYQWPNPTIITVFSYSLVMVFYHWQQRNLWWDAAGRATGNGWGWLRRALLVITLTVPPTLFVITLVLLEVQSIMAVVLNLMSAFSVAVLSLLLFGKLSLSETLMTNIKQQFI